MDALLVVDMQHANFDGVANYQPDSVIENVNRIIRHCRNAQIPVVHIQHQDQSPEYLKGSPNWQILPQIDQLPHDIRVDKTCCDAFIDTTLQSHLSEHNIRRLLVVGSATDFCVDATVKGGIARGYDVTVVGDAHTAEDRPHVSAKQLIAHYNWNWGCLETGNQSLSVMTTEQWINREV